MLQSTEPLYVEISIEFDDQTLGLIINHRASSHYRTPVERQLECSSFETGEAFDSFRPFYDAVW